MTDKDRWLEGYLAGVNRNDRHPQHAGSQAYERGYQAGMAIDYPTYQRRIKAGLISSDEKIGPRKSKEIEIR